MVDRIARLRTTPLWSLKLQLFSAEDSQLVDGVQDAIAPRCASLAKTGVVLGGASTAHDIRRPRTNKAQPSTVRTLWSVRAVCC